MALLQQNAVLKMNDGSGTQPSPMHHLGRAGCHEDSWVARNGLHLLQHVHALHELRPLHLKRLQPTLQGGNGLAVRVLLLPLPLAIALIRPPAQHEF